MNKRAVRIANVSGFYGDRLSAATEMLAGPDPIDVLTGDYLAELTMLILWKARQRDQSTGYATTFLRQMEQTMGVCLERGIRIVTNAGGLNPHGLAERLHELASQLGLSPRIAVIEGDDVLERFASSGAITANAYLGGWGIAAGLEAGADIVVAPRVTDASLVVGPSAWWHGWRQDDVDALAGAVAAGHIIECGTQATGGNYSFADDELPDAALPGFPIAEVEHDGSSVITKQPGTGGRVSVGTVTAQLLYEIADPAYANPDVVARFDTTELEQEAPDRVRVTKTRGEPPPTTLKVGLNLRGGWRNAMTLVLTGLDAHQKAERQLRILSPVLSGIEHVDSQLIGCGGLALLRIVVRDLDREKVDRQFSDAVTESILSSYAGAFTTTPPGPASEYGIFRAEFVEPGLVEHAVVLPDGSRVVIPHALGIRASHGITHAIAASDVSFKTVPTILVPLGRIAGARSGDKGGNANVGVWVRSDEAFCWLSTFLTVERIRALLPDSAFLPVHRFELPRLRALNFVIEGLLGEGASSTSRFDAQAKGLGEELRSREVEVPKELLD